MNAVSDTAARERREIVRKGGPFWLREDGRQHHAGKVCNISDLSIRNGLNGSRQKRLYSLGKMLGISCQIRLYQRGIKKTEMSASPNAASKGTG